MSYIFDNNNFQVSPSQIELNNVTKETKIGKQSVEIFTAILYGKDLTKYGDKVDKAVNYLKNLGNMALNGSYAQQLQAKAEINAIRTETIQAPLVKRLNLFDFMGNVTRVGMNEEVRYKVYELQGKKSSIQANSGSFPFPTHKYRTEILKTKTITGGLLMDYREIQTGNTDAMAQANEQVITDMMNQMFYEIMVAMHDGIKNATSVKNFVEVSPLTKTAVDDVRKKARRWGDVTISGDYSMISQMEDFAGFKTDVAGNSKMFSEAVMEEIRKTGMLKTYYGHSIVEIPNQFNTTQLNNDGNYFDTVLPEGLLFFLPQGMYAPLQIGMKGDVRSMAATDINLAAEVQRFDMEFGSILIKEYVPAIGLISDTAFAVDKR
jgi:hypothetical protein